MDPVWKDFLQLGFSFFVAGFLLIELVRDRAYLRQKLDELLAELRGLREDLVRLLPRP
jgi:hypothetical protein